MLGTSGSPPHLHLPGFCRKGQQTWSTRCPCGATDTPAWTIHLLGIPLAQAWAGHCSWLKGVIQNERQALC